MLLLSTITTVLLAQTATAAITERAPSTSPPSATTKNGTYVGLDLPTFAQEAFLGIPYAQPPITSLRLRQPSRLTQRFTTPRPAQSYPPHCPGFGGDNTGKVMNEDCLYLNVVRPTGTGTKSKLPVGIWIHGGGFQMGGTDDQRYNGSYVVQRSVQMRKNIIFVSINYRVGAGGFLSSKEVVDAGVQNLGLYDQRLAIEWVHENILAFGGDPNKITIWGESAGAKAVANQLLAFSSTSNPLYRAAILQSGSPTAPTFIPTEALQPTYDGIVSRAGCASATDSLQCLREVSFETFFSAVNGTSWLPTIDGRIVPELPSEQLRKGKFVKVPLLLGTNTDEGTAFGVRGIKTDLDLRSALLLRYPNLTQSSISRILTTYIDDPSLGSPYGTGDGYLSTGLQDKRSCSIFGDTAYIAGRREFAEKMSEREKGVWSYRFDQVPVGLGMEYSATHFQDVSYVFSNLLATRPGDQALSTLMTSYWISFIHSLDPNDTKIKGAPSWPKYSKKDPKNVVFKRQGSYVEKDDWRKEGIQLVNEIAKELAR